jgi:hypothetical protein
LFGAPPRVFELGLSSAVLAVQVRDPLQANLKIVGI